jgi:hypothetical protein
MAYDLTALLILAAACALPAQLLITRSAVRRERAGSIEQLSSLFDKGYPQLEFVRAKYQTRQTRRERAGGGETVVGLADEQSLLALLASGAIFTAISYAGFLILLQPLTTLFAPSNALQPLLFWVLPTGVADLPARASITGFAFLGAYMVMALYLQKAVLNYELNALSFMRATLVLIVGTVVATVTCRFAAGATGGFGLPPNGGGAQALFGVAFVLGTSYQFAFTKLMHQLNLSARKARASIGTETICVEVVDGIDSDMAFRLEETNIYDIQNLATANPLQLYVETPYGLMQCFDWVLQAQLCLVLGQQQFAKMKALGIRTIFDLERAILARGAPDDYVRGMGAAIFADPAPLRGPAVAGQPGPIDPQAVRHAVAVMTDDMHVHRLRVLWRIIYKKFSQDDPDQWLYDVGALPGDPDDRRPERATERPAIPAANVAGAA